MKQEVKINQTDYTVFILVRDTSGNAKTTLVFGDIDLAYARVETDNDVTTADVAPATLASLTAAHDDWGFLLVSDTDHPGLYRLDIADAVFATGAWSAVVTLTGAGLEPSHLEFVMVPKLPYTGVQADLTHVMGTILTEGAVGRLAAALIKFLDVATPVFTAESVDQTGDSYGRIGANGAGLSNINLPNQTMDITGSLSGAVGSVTGSVGSVVGAVGSVTGAVGSVTGAVGSVTAGVTLTGATIDSVWDEVMEVGITARQSLRVSNAFLAGETNGGGTVTIRFRDLADTLNRITMTVDVDGDRSGVALNLA